jgi:tape measure domain-containing protein
MGDLEFGLSFQDQISGPSRAASGALQAIQSNLGGVASAASAATSATNTTAASLQGVSGASSALKGIKSDLQGVAAAATAAASAAARANAAIGAAKPAGAAATLQKAWTSPSDAITDSKSFRRSMVRERARAAVAPVEGPDDLNLKSKGYAAWRAVAAKAATSAFTGYQTTQVSRTAKALESLGGIAKRTWQALGGGGGAGGAGKALEEGAKSFERSGGFLRRALEFATGTLLERAIEKSLELGKVIAESLVGAADFGQKARLAFGSLAKHGADPEKIFTHVRTLAQDLGLDVFDTTKQYQKFLAMQFNPHQADALINMGSDLMAIGANAEEVRRAFLQMGQIKAKGRLQGEELLVLAENGLSTQLVFESIAKQLGISMDQVQKKVSGGAVNASVALNAIGDAILKKTHSTKFGEAGKRVANQTISGLWGQLKAGIQNATIDIGDKLAPVLTSQLKGMLLDFSSFAKSAEGVQFFKDLASAIRDFAVAIKDALPTMRSMLALSNALLTNRVSGKGGEPAGEAYSGVGAAAGALAGARFGGVKGAAIGAAAGGGLAAWINNSSVGKSVNKFFGLKEYATQANADAVQIGQKIGDGIVAGMQSKRTNVFGAGSDLGNAAIEGASSPQSLDVHSPSRAFEWLGEMSGEGLGVGFRATTAANVSAVQSVTRSMQNAAYNVGSVQAVAGMRGAVNDNALAGVDTSIPSYSQTAAQIGGYAGAVSSGGGGRSTNDISITINISGVSGDPEQVAEAAKRGAVEGLHSVIEQLSSEAAA